MVFFIIIDFASFYDFHIDFGIVLTVCYFLFLISLLNIHRNVFIQYNIGYRGVKG
jgi:hypothetical protein